MVNRPRILRATPLIRELSREVKISEKALILPIFIKEGKNIKSPIKSMDKQYHYSVDRVAEEIESALEKGVNKFILFGLPDKKDSFGSLAYCENGVIQNALRTLKAKYGSKIFLITDVCMCEYTDHGHCGILDGEKVDNDSTLLYLGKIAISHALAGADMIAPSDMMDGRVKFIRKSLDENGFKDIGIMSYGVKYASYFYGPFREAVNSKPSFGDRKTYQMDFHNKKEAVKEAMLDVNEGSDMIIVKPALSYLDIVQTVSNTINIPVVAYSVSGEYAMIKSAGKMGFIDEYGVMCESAISIFRAGADVLISYFAKEIATAIKNGDIG